MESFETKARDYFGEIIINKALIHQAGFGSRAIPTYVGESDQTKRKCKQTEIDYQKRR